MGCCTANIVTDLVFSQEKYIIGNSIFKPINTKISRLNNNYSEEEINLISECEKILEKSEESRQKIAKSFEQVLKDTGACVLNQPTLERAVTTYIVFFLTQIQLEANSRNVELSQDDFSLSELIKFSKESPYVSINSNILNGLKNKFGFDFYKNDSLVNGKNSLVEFLKSVPQSEIILQGLFEELSNLYKKTNSKMTLINILPQSLDSIQFLINLFSDIISSLSKIQSQMTKPSKLKKYFRIAKNAAERFITDPKEIAFYYALGDNCGKIENWTQNIGYKVVDPTKY